MLNAKRRLEDRNGNHKVGGEDDIFVPVNGQTVRIEWLFNDVEGSKATSVTAGNSLMIL